MDELTSYLEKLLPQQSGWTNQLERYAKDHNIPIMDQVSIHFLMQLIRMKKPAKILEIGTAIGYSALRMSEAYPNAHITTIERDETNYNLAVQHIEQLDKERSIQIIYGDALDILEQFGQTKEKPVFDFVFIDAAKAQYQRFFELVTPLVSREGVVISDNVLFKGYVVHQNATHKRLGKLADKIRDYNSWLSNLEDFSTSIVPIGDGIAISVRI